MSLVDRQSLDRDIRAIQDHHFLLNSLYSDHRETVQHLQNALLTQILPNVVDELGLDKAARDRAEEWLHDDLSIFRTLKRHKFTKAFALESLRSILIWRLSHLKAQDPRLFPPSPLHVLPPPATDILRRPILILRLANLANLQEDPREHILRTVEGLRINLHNINASSPPEIPMAGPVLQYILLVDMENASMRNFVRLNLDLLTWYIHEVAPRYPGMFGTVFVINFSWTQSGIWTVIRLALPESVQYRIFFPSKETLHECIRPSSLPQDYWGLLPLLSGIPNVLDVPQTTTLTPSLSASLSSLDEEEASGASPSLTHAPGDNTAACSTRRKIASLAHVSPRSQYNPFYGYPIGPPPYSLSPASLPYLRHGRRRKRDLIRTLATLWWEKWRSRVSWTVSFLFVFFYVRWWWRQRRNSMFLIRGEPH
ncbi:CRAL-TRIO domain-containing protein [Lactarius psammicola]|nr:CRAL-TRIO domain-containing protein [Lactarius psammicola]